MTEDQSNKAAERKQTGMFLHAEHVLQQQVKKPLHFVGSNINLMKKKQP